MADELIRPFALPNRANPVASEKVPVDNGSTVGGATIEALVLAGRPAASQAEAEAGVNSTKAMTPLTTKQAVDAQVPTKIDGAIADLNLGSAAQASTTDFATSAQGGKADSAIQTVVEGDGISVDATDPQNPIISYTGTGISDGDKGGIVVSDGGTVWNVKDGTKGDIIVSGDGAVWELARDFETVALLLSDTAMGYSSAPVIVVAGQRVTAQGFQYEVAASGASDNHVTTAGGVKLYVLANDIVAFGAIGDGVTINTGAIQTALATGRSLFVPQGRFIVDQTLLMDKPGQSLVGFGTPYFGAVSEIKMVSGTPQAVFSTLGEGYTFRNLKITGQSTLPGSIGILVGPTSGPADRDVYVTNCFINTTQDSIFSYGRGVYVEDSRLVATGNCLNLNWPNPFTQTGGADDTAKTGFRAIYVRNCRLQAIAGVIVRNVGANAQNMTGLTMVGNYVDGRNGVMYGSVRNGTVSGNTFINSNAIAFLLDNVDGLTITGNTFSGLYDDTGNNTTPHTADVQNVIYLNSGFTAKGITFTGNTVANLYKDGIFLNGSWSNIVISGNTFLDALRGNNNSGLAPAQYGIVRTNTPGSGLVFTNNACEVGNWTRNASLVNSGGSAVANYQVFGNTFNAAYISEHNLPNTFNPLLVTNATGFTSVTYSSLRGGRWEKIGKMVFVQFLMRTEGVTLGSASGNLQIDLNDLPFTCAANSAGKGDAVAPIAIGTVLNWTNGPIQGQIRPGEKRIDLFKRATTTSNIANMTPSDVATGASSNIIQASLTFLVD